MKSGQCSKHSAFQTLIHSLLSWNICPALSEKFWKDSERALVILSTIRGTIIPTPNRIVQPRHTLEIRAKVEARHATLMDWLMALKCSRDNISLRQPISVSRLA